MAITTQVLPGTYELDKTHSTVDFAVRHLTVSTFRASFRTFDARLVIDDDAAVLAAEAAVDSITIDDPEFREHVVRGSDFFAADEHPRISFQSTRVELSEDGATAVDGVLEIRGIKRLVSVGGELTPPTEDPYGNTRIGLALHARVDRRRWALDWQMPLPAGGDALGWDVEITAHLELTKSP